MFNFVSNLAGQLLEQVCCVFYCVESHVQQVAVTLEAIARSPLIAHLKSIGKVVQEMDLAACLLKLVFQLEDLKLDFTTGSHLVNAVLSQDKNTVMAVTMLVVET